MNNTFDTQYFTAKEFAEKLKISVKTLYNKVNEGKVKPDRLFSNRGHYRFTQRHIEEYNQSNHGEKNEYK